MSRGYLHLRGRLMARGEHPAVYSRCRTYCYRLDRVWDAADPLLGWVLLHPPARHGHHVDPDIDRCAEFARAWGYGGIVTRTLYGARVDSPAALAGYADPVGPDNDAELACCCEQDLTVLAWGGDAPARRAAQVISALHRDSIRQGTSLAVVGWTQSGQPCRPREAPARSVPRCFTPEAVFGTRCVSHAADDHHWAVLVGGAA